MMPYVDRATIYNAWHYVNDWRNDDTDLPIPSGEFGDDLAHAIDVLLQVTQRYRRDS